MANEDKQLTWDAYVEDFETAADQARTGSSGSRGLHKYRKAERARLQGLFGPGVMTRKPGGKRQEGMHSSHVLEPQSTAGAGLEANNPRIKRGNAFYQRHPAYQESAELHAAMITSRGDRIMKTDAELASHGWSSRRAAVADGMAALRMKSADRADDDAAQMSGRIGRAFQLYNIEIGHCHHAVVTAENPLGHYKSVEQRRAANNSYFHMVLANPQSFVLAPAANAAAVKDWHRSPYRASLSSDGQMEAIVGRGVALIGHYPEDAHRNRIRRALCGMPTAMRDEQACRGDQQRISSDGASPQPPSAIVAGTGTLGASDRPNSESGDGEERFVTAPSSPQRSRASSSSRGSIRDARPSTGHAALEEFDDGWGSDVEREVIELASRYAHLGVTDLPQGRVSDADLDRADRGLLRRTRTTSRE